MDAPSSPGSIAVGERGAGRALWRPGPLQQGEILFTALLLGVLLASVLLDPGSEGLTVAGFELPAVCLWRKLFGFGCPGCGLTRSFVFVGHGELVQAFRMHRLGPLLYAVVVWLAAVRVWGLLRLGLSWLRRGRR